MFIILNWLPLSAPFLYVSSAAGFRLLVVPLIGVVLSVLIAKPVLRFRLDILLAMAIVALLGVWGALAGFLDVTFAALAFFVFMYWPLFVSRRSLENVDAAKLWKSYLWAALFCAVGVVVQRFSYQYFGIEFGKIDTMYKRTGFGFLWTDYSFLSTFLVSAVPVGIARCRGVLRVLVVGLLVVASVATSSRAGLVAVFAVTIYVLLGELVRGIFSGGLKRSSLFLGASFLVFSMLALFSWSSLTDRELSFRSSGRISSYMDALAFVAGNPIFGAMSDEGAYLALYGFLPHNMFLYVVVMGGFVLLGLFVVWLVLTLKWLRGGGRTEAQAVAICLIGLQLVPSFFSAYFFAMLISILIVKRLKSKQRRISTIVDHPSFGAGCGH